jgi:hypothetical protein
MRVNLEGSDYQLHVDWSQREARWYVSLHDAQDELLCGPLKLVCNWPLWRYYSKRPGMPPGQLWCMATGSNLDPPAIDELGEDRRCVLSYFTAEDSA